jgi:hypothetical protein
MEERHFHEMALGFHFVDTLSYTDCHPSPRPTPRGRYRHIRFKALRRSLLFRRSTVRTHIIHKECGLPRLRDRYDDHGTHAGLIVRSFLSLPPSPVRGLPQPQRASPAPLSPPGLSCSVWSVTSVLSVLSGWLYSHRHWWCPTCLVRRYRVVLVLYVVLYNEPLSQTK